MADTVAITAGSGTTIGTDEVTIGGTLQHVQRVKLVDGTDGGTALIPGDATLGLAVKPSGNVAHDAVDSGNPVKIGAKAKGSLDDVTLVAADDRTDAYADLDGVMVMKPYCPFGDILVERVSNTNGTSTAFTNFGAVASTRNYITTLVVFNDSTTNGYVDIRDGTAGTILLTLPLPAKGGSVFQPTLPLRQPTANTALAYDVNAALTTVYISAIGFQSKA
jgi:hypothetical protein